MHSVPENIECFVVFFTDKFDFDVAIRDFEIESEDGVAWLGSRKICVEIEDVGEQSHVYFGHFSPHNEFSGVRVSAHKREFSCIVKVCTLRDVHDRVGQRIDFAASSDD